MNGVKKSEMVRRSKLIRWIEKQIEHADMLQRHNKSGIHNDTLAELTVMIDSFKTTFDIENHELNI